ncbi:MAG: class I SAM-dependent methyltransferase [Gemmatimonadota bacterium]|nr:class I SAM-dependent methyltransferase [Gemmatimonadota bacterium]MDP6802423.1 class I SAM-dependent methyltransferase [Gemmatimonadota bacterium]MDP7031062.1 class I SAM-dependent methyltransferase [Gemmatimonadota bacterium]
MATAGGCMQLALDSGVRGLAGLRRGLSGGGEPAGSGGPLPGAQAHQDCRVLGQGEDALLRLGRVYQSLWRTVEWRLMREACHDLPRPVADLGCGDGAFGALLRDKIDHGFDGDAEILPHCDLSVYEAVAAVDLRETLPLPDGSLASVFSNSTFEHIVPVERALASVARALKPGGTFVISVPTVGLVHAFESRYTRAFANRLNTILGHHNLWSWAEWETRLRDVGFVGVNMRGYLTVDAARWFASRQLAPWEPLERRFPEYAWKRSVRDIRRHVRDSLTITDEKATTCVLVEAVRGGEAVV